MRYFILIAVFFVNLFAGANVCAYVPEPVDIIYVHGFNAAEKDIVLEEAQRVSDAFKGRKMGRYVFTGCHRVVFWADLLDSEDTFNIHKSGLLDINTRYNVSKKKESTKSFDSSFLNPFFSALNPKDKGAGSGSIYFRNMINDFLYQIFLFNETPELKEIVYDRIQTEADTINRRYVIIGHSFGAVAAVDFIEERLINDKIRSGKFVGLITSADLNTTFHANKWRKTLKQDNPKNIAKYFIEHGKFWISYNHRNDVIATNLPEQLLCIKAKGCGFIISKSTEMSYLNPYSAMLHVFGYDNGKIRAHSWLHLKPDDFANKVIEAYNEKIVSPEYTSLQCGIR